MKAQCCGRTDAQRGLESLEAAVLTEPSSSHESRAGPLDVQWLFIHGPSPMNTFSTLLHGGATCSGSLNMIKLPQALKFSTVSLWILTWIKHNKLFGPSYKWSWLWRFLFYFFQEGIGVKKAPEVSGKAPPIARDIHCAFQQIQKHEYSVISKTQHVLTLPCLTWILAFRP